MILTLYEFKCLECEETLLLEISKEPENCPYCSGANIDYAGGEIKPVMNYVTRNHFNEIHDLLNKK